jgi:hypothetical protein
MTVDRPESELTHAPGLAPERLDDLDPRRDDATMVCVGVVHDEIAEVRVIAELGGGDRVGAFPRHDPARVPHEHAPAGIADLTDLEPQHVTVERPRSFEVGDGEDEIGPTDRHVHPRRRPADRH